ncbi:MAG: hypothetical protein M3Y54_15000 [Bacteroidota bacterium]|nr:hypothetical protein [Bacteroidota bacterium]
MKFLPRLLGLGLLSLLILFLAMGCESTKPAEYGSPNRIIGSVAPAPESRQIVHFTDTTTEYVTTRSELATAFIRQFGDGTVIDNVQVRKAPVEDGAPTAYYLIGMGLRNGMFRAMALRLSTGGDNSYYLSPNAERYTITGTNCPMCYFNFENGRIVGTTCGERISGATCDLKVEPNNGLFTTANK